MSRYIIFGDSHIGNLLKLREQTKGGFPALFSHDFELYWVDNGLVALNLSYDLADGTWLRTPMLTAALCVADIAYKYTDIIAPGTAETRLLILLGSVDSHILGFHPEWGRYCLTQESTDRQYLPPSLILHTIEYRLRGMVRVLAELRAAGYSVDILGGPPPHRNNDFIAKFSHNPVADPRTRLAIFAAMYAGLKSIAARAHVGFIDSSRWLAEKDGFLRQDFECDGVHANEKAARAMLLGLDQSLSQTAAQSS